MSVQGARLSKDPNNEKNGSVDMKRAEVVRLLEEYPDLDREIKVLQVACGTVACIGEPINFPTTRCCDGQHGVSHCLKRDATELEALSFRERAHNQKREECAAIRAKLEELGEKKEKLERYVDMLDTKQSGVIRARYFEKKSWQEIEEELKQTVKTLRHHLNDGITELVSMYTIVENVSNST